MAGLMLIQGSDEAVSVGTVEREDLPGRAEVIERRNMDWFIDHVIGRPGLDGVRRRKTVRLIAALYGVHRDTVREGISKARATREAIADVARLERVG